MFKKLFKKYITVLIVVSLIIPSTLLNLVNLDKAYAATPGDVVINEIMVNSSEEWIELYNNSADPIPLTGWYFTSIGVPSLYTIDSETIPGNGFIKFTIGSKKLVNPYDDITLMGFDNDDFLTEMDQITYGPNPLRDMTPAPIANKTIGRINDGERYLYTNLTPTPGLSNNTDPDNNNLPPNLPPTISLASVSSSETYGNPTDYINTESQTRVETTFTYGATYTQDDTTTAIIYDNNITHNPVSALNTQTLDASGFADGNNLYLSGYTQRGDIKTEYLPLINYGNLVYGTQLIKDTDAPEAPTAASVSATANNPANTINSLTKSNVSVSVDLPAPLLATDTVYVDLSDTSEPGRSATGSITDQTTSSVLITNINTVTNNLIEGGITVNTIVVDQAGNPSDNFTGTAAVKDTLAPTSEATLSNVYGPLTWPDQISGTTSDSLGGSGVAIIKSSIQRNSDNKYYNGVDWQTDLIWLNTSYYLGSWTLLLSSSKLNNGVAYTVKSQATDFAGNTQSSYTPKTFTYDTSAPNGNFTINDGAIYTTSNSTTLKITASADATKMQFSNDNVTWSGWENLAASKSWALSSSDGNKTVYGQFQNAAGNESAKVSNIITFDTAAPTGTVSINSGTTYANSKNVTLTLAATDLTSGLDKMKFSNNGTTWSNWETYNTTKSWDLLSTTYSTTNDGVKTVYAKFKDKAGNETTAVISDEITFDATAPVNDSLNIDSDAAYTTLGTANLTLSATDTTSGLDKMMFSNDGTTWTTAEAYTTTKTAWALTSGDGIKTIYVKFVDKAGNETLAISKSIIKDSTLPTGTMSINNGASYTKSTNVTLNLTTTDSTGVKSMAFSNNGVDFTAWEDYLASKAYTLPTGDGSKTVYGKFMDKAGNVSLIVSDSINLDTISPSDPKMIDSPNGQTITKGGEIKLSGTSEPNSQVTIKIYSDAIFTDNTTANSAGNWSYTVTSATLDKLATGDHKITLTVTDSAGNSTNETQIAQFTLNDQVQTTSESPTTVTQTDTSSDQSITSDDETQVETIGPENGETKGDDSSTKTTRTLVTLAILIIAIGAVSGGYYGYQWWMEKENTKKSTKNKKTKSKKEEKFGRW